MENTRQIPDRKLTLATETPCPATSMQVELIFRFWKFPFPLRWFMLYWKIIIYNQINLQKGFKSKCHSCKEFKTEGTKVHLGKLNGGWQHPL